MKKKHKRMINRSLPLMAFAVATILALSFAGAAIMGSISTGYGGMIAEITDIRDIDWENGIAAYQTPFNGGPVVLQGSTASVDEYKWGVLTNPDPTAVAVEITGRLLRDQEKNDAEPINYYTFENTDEFGKPVSTRVAETVEHLILGVIVRSKAGGGVGAATEYSIEITISENDFNVWNDADKVAAFILDVVTLEPLKSTNDLLAKGAPTSGGTGCDKVDWNYGTIPTWIQPLFDSGNSKWEPDNLALFTEWTFGLEVIKMKPNTGGLLGDIREGENELEWSIGIDVLTFGYWTDVGGDVNWEAKGEDDTGGGDFFGDIFNFFDNMVTEGPAGIMTIIVFFVVIVAIIFVCIRTVPAVAGIGAAYAGRKRPEAESEKYEVQERGYDGNQLKWQKTEKGSKKKKKK